MYITFTNSFENKLFFFLTSTVAIKNRYCSSKSVVVLETIDAVRQLILQDRHVANREIEITLGISETSRTSILHEHFTVKKICLRQSLKKINQSEWQKCFDNCFKRMQNV